jgi:hypothetical protein
MSDSRRFETELHEGDLVFTVRRGSDLMFSKPAVRELQEEAEAFVERAVSDSEAAAISRDSPVVTSRHIGRNVRYDSLHDRLRASVNVIGGGLFCILLDAMWEMRTAPLSLESLQLAIACGFFGFGMMMIGLFGWPSILRSWRR